MDVSALAAAVEALLFISDSPLPAEKLAGILQVDSGLLAEALERLKVRYSLAESGLCIQELAGGLQLVTRPHLAEYVERLVKVKPPTLSQAALETLAIIAYRQPVTRAEIEMIRGVKSDSAISTLLERNMVRELGRKPVLGRPMLYGTTREFLKQFGLNALEDLPEVRTSEEGEYESGSGGTV